MSLLLGACVTALVLVVRGPRGRPATGVAQRPASGAGRADAAGPVRSARSPGPAPLPAGGRLPWRRSSRPPASRGLPLVLADVAARLRAGADPPAAWHGALGGHVTPGGPTLDDLTGGGPRGADDGAHAAVVVAASRLAAELGTPLAPLLDRVGEGLAARAEAESDRRAALAGPRATARVLTGLPALGVALGVAVGADPVGVLLDGGVGSAALGGGLVLLLAGRGWMRLLTGRAAAAGRPT